MLQNRISPLLSIFFRVSSGTVGNSVAVPRYVFFFHFVISCCPWIDGADEVRVFRGEGRSPARAISGRAEVII